MTRTFRKLDGARLRGRRVLVVEDRYLIAEEVARMVREMGGEVLGPAANLHDALALMDGETSIDLALLDVNLAHGDVYPAATELTRRQIPFIFATGYERWVIPSEFKDAAQTEKPLSVRSQTEAMEQLSYM